MKRLHLPFKPRYQVLFFVCLAVLWLGATTFVVAASGIQKPDAAPDQIHLAWVSDPATTMNVVWRTQDGATPSEVQYRLVGDLNWQTASGGQRPSGTAGVLHEVALSGLTADTAYEYQVRADGGGWSAVYTFHTVVAGNNPANFDAIYFADTGLIGRTDGLATGTAQVISEMVALQPDVLLPGGDYAYYNTEKDRFPNLNDAIDAWFNQMQPIASGVPMMPTYGNHEVLLEENVEDWLARFPTPTGYDNRRYYSFDIADAHFISIYAPQAINDPNALAWIEQDIIDAQAAGQKWIIPYFHVAPFADGTNHSSSQSLRNTLGPIFEQYNVPLVIASHDQAYERTWPLTDAANTAVPTTTAHRACVPETEGVTWVKVSPSGKLSNISWGFSPFGTTPAPAWTSVRHNALHHFLRLRFASDETLQVELWGVVGNGSAPTLVDTFLLADSCEDELLVNEPVQSLKLFADETASVAVDVTHSASTAVSFTVASSEPWLQPSTLLGTTGTPVAFDVDPSALDPGTYTAVVTFTPTSGTALAGRLVTTLVVRGDTSAQYQLYVSQNADRSDPQPLYGAVISGTVYVFTQPDTSDIEQVRFLLNDAKHQREGIAPYDFAGTSGGNANPYDTAVLTDGEHIITAVVVANDSSTETAEARFTVQNDPLAVVWRDQSATIPPSTTEFGISFFLLGLLTMLTIVYLSGENSIKVPYNSKF